MYFMTIISVFYDYYFSILWLLFQYLMTIISVFYYYYFSILFFSIFILFQYFVLKYWEWIVRTRGLLCLCSSVLGAIK